MLFWSLDMDKKDKIYKSKLASKHDCLALFFLCLVFFCVGEGFSFLTEWHNNPIYIYIVEVIDELHMNLTLIELKLSLTWQLLKREIIPWSRITNNCNLSYYKVVGLIMNLINGTHNIVTCFEGFDPRNNVFQRFLLLVSRVLTLERRFFFKWIHVVGPTIHVREGLRIYL